MRSTTVCTWPKNKTFSPTVDRFVRVRIPRDADVFTPVFQVREFGTFEWTSQDDLVVKSTLEDVPYFNAPICLENKQMIGKVSFTAAFGT